MCMVKTLSFGKIRSGLLLMVCHGQSMALSRANPLKPMHTAFTAAASVSSCDIYHSCFAFASTSFFLFQARLVPHGAACHAPAQGKSVSRSARVGLLLQ